MYADGQPRTYERVFGQGSNRLRIRAVRNGRAHSAASMRPRAAAGLLPSASDYEYPSDDVVRVVDRARCATALLAVRNTQATTTGLIGATTVEFEQGGEDLVSA